MISLEFKVTWFQDKGEYTTVIAEPKGGYEYDLQKHEKYKTIIINGQFPDYIEKYTKYIFTISDYPNKNGNYRLLFMGKLPNESCFENLTSFIKANPLKDKEVKELYDNMTEGLSVNGLSLLWELIKVEDYKNYIDSNSDKTELLVGDDKITFAEFYVNNKNIIKQLRTMYVIAKKKFKFLCELEDMGVKNDNIKYKILSNLPSSVNYEQVIKDLRANPYLLMDKADMKIEAVDTIALSLGIKENDDRRIIAITESNLRVYGETGQTWVNIDKYINSISKTSMLYPYNTVNMSLSDIELKEKLIQLAGFDSYWTDESKVRVASRLYYDFEKQLCDTLMLLNTDEASMTSLDLINSKIRACERKERLKYTEEQKQAIINTFKQNIAVINGAAGTGKSTIAKAVVSMFNSVLVTALSGKAALRISETTGIAGKTMHSALNSCKGKFFDNDLIVLDEASMLGLDIVLQFFYKVKPGTMILILGDNCQLLPIGAGNFFSDLLASKSINVNTITQVHRQALESNIIKFATDVRHQETIKEATNDTVIKDDFELLMTKDDNEVLRLTISKFFEHYEKFGIDEIMTVTPMRKHAYIVNNHVQNRLIKEGYIQGKAEIELSLEDDRDLKFKIYKNDRVINIKNNYKCPTPEGSDVDIMNGALGTFIEKKKIKVAENKEKTVFIINFDGIGLVEFSYSDMQNVLLGYAITVHKSQGSQAKVVIYVQPTSCSPRLSCSEMVYTAVTRAREKVIVIGSRGSLNKAIENKELNSKQTLLKEFLDQNIEDAVVSDVDDKPSGETTEHKIDPKTRERYDRNNAQKRAKRRNEEGLLDREQSKLDKVNLIKKLYAEGKTQQEIVEITGLTKGTVSKYLRL